MSNWSPITAGPGLARYPPCIADIRGDKLSEAWINPTNLMSCNFTFAHYAECLAMIRGTDVELIHDIDFPPHNLLRMAHIDYSFGIRAKYFVRLHARFYNALSHENMAIFKELTSKYGHQLGLHFEPGYYSKSQISDAISLESRLLESFCAVPVKVISVHSPLKGGGVDSSDVPDGMQLYCYNAPHYEDKKYISDSGGRWREGCMCQHIGKHRSMIILTHPNWWFEQTPAENY